MLKCIEYRINKTTQRYSTVLNDKTIYFLFMKGCAPCKIMKPRVLEVAEDLGLAVEFIPFELKGHPTGAFIKKTFTLRSAPTIIFNGKIILEQKPVSEEELLKLLK